MNNNLPTTPGPYWFLEAETNEWELYFVTTLDGEGMVCHNSEHNVTSRCLVSEMPEGQWAKAHSPDAGVEAWAVFNQFGDIVAADDTWAGAWFSAARLAGTEQDFLRRGGYTCEPVTIYRKGKE